VSGDWKTHPPEVLFPFLFHFMFGFFWKMSSKIMKMLAFVSDGCGHSHVCFII
jgi:hypothetical protein